MMQPNIIMHLDSALSWRGGQQQVLNLVQGLQQRNIISFIACPPKSILFNEALSRVISVFPLHIFGEWDILAVRRLRQMIRNLKVNILHCHDSHAHTIGFLATLGMDNCKLIVTRRVDFSIGNNLINKFKYKNSVDRFIAVSNGVKKVLELGGIDRARITVVHDGIEINNFLCRDKATNLYREFGLDPAKPVIGNIAALAPHKDQRTLLQAAKIVLEQIPEAQFLVVGTGALEEELKQLAADLEIQERVKFTGFRSDVPQILTILNIFAVSSHLEGLGSSTLEAMAAGLPIVATRTGGIPEIVENSINGILVPPRDSAALAKGIIELLRDNKRREKMGNASLQMVKNFSVDKMVEGNVAVYSQVTA
ncbi:MAG: glycosyltransferase family 4 protein [bacterium]|nr:glycosyltransferase family 4 protein [bacterium]MDD5756855.1 glycosyltransferase family 4 protein [bacterium]